MDGVIIKAVGGFYFVRAGDQVFRCSIRGKIRQQKSQAMVGDMVSIILMGDDDGVVEKILPRRNELVRPLIANVDQAVVIFATKQPDPSALLLDRFLVQVRAAEITPVICFNKFDLAEKKEPELISHYDRTGYPVIRVSAKTGQGLESLHIFLKDRINVLAGPSGVGKSSLLNKLQPGLELQTGDISRKLQRGKHTTRHVELIPLEQGGLVADTPGFSNVYLPAMKREELPGYYPEFKSYADQCRFNGCLHYREPNCAVKEAVRKERVSMLRYQNYLSLLAEVIESERRY
ncbi:MAG: ribosome small subunit-dependent GTPase A [Desulfotomaculaceae bacterium]